MTLDEIKRRFEFSTDFNEIFDAFEVALALKVRDLDLYRLLFMNPSLSPDELCLFGEKLAREVEGIAFEIYGWLARVFEATHSMLDNYELTFEYYRKAAAVRPEEVSCAGALQTLNAFAPLLRSVATAEDWERLWEELLRAIGSHRVGDRPDRIEPRAVKRRPKNFPKLKEPRAQARRKLMKGAKRVGKKR